MKPVSFVKIRARRALTVIRSHDVQAFGRDAARSSCVTCTAAHCCRIVPLALLVEAIAAIDAFARAGGDLAALRRRAEEDVAFLRAAPDPSRDYMLSGHTCPLLDAATNRCRIYASRPTTCRGYFVVSPPADCAPDESRTVRVIDTRRKVARLMQEAVNASPEIPGYLGTFPEMLVAAFVLLARGREGFAAWAEAEAPLWGEMIDRINAFERARMGAG